jgi:actin-related protein 9
MPLQNGIAPKAPAIKDEAMNGQEAGISKPPTTYIRPRRPYPPMPDAKVSEYLVGTSLDEAIAAGENLEIYWPLEEGNDIPSWPQAEALW